MAFSVTRESCTPFHISKQKSTALLLMLCGTVWYGYALVYLTTLIFTDIYVVSSFLLQWLSLCPCSSISVGKFLQITFLIEGRAPPSTNYSFSAKATGNCSPGSSTS